MKTPTVRGDTRWQKLYVHRAWRADPESPRTHFIQKCRLASTPHTPPTLHPQTPHHTHRLGPTRRIHCALTPHSPQTLHPLHTLHIHSAQTAGTASTRRGQTPSPHQAPGDLTYAPHMSQTPASSSSCLLRNLPQRGSQEETSSLPATDTNSAPGPTALYGAEWRRGAGVAGICSSTTTPSTTGPRRLRARRGAWSHCLRASLFLGARAGVVFPCACLHPGFLTSMECSLWAKLRFLRLVAEGASPLLFRRAN